MRTREIRIRFVRSDFDHCQSTVPQSVPLLFTCDYHPVPPPSISPAPPLPREQKRETTVATLAIPVSPSRSAVTMARVAVRVQAGRECRWLGMAGYRYVRQVWLRANAKKTTTKNQRTREYIYMDIYSFHLLVWLLMNPLMSLTCLVFIHHNQSRECTEVYYYWRLQFYYAEFLNQ